MQKLAPRGREGDCPGPGRLKNQSPDGGRLDGDWRVIVGPSRSPSLVADHYMYRTQPSALQSLTDKVGWPHIY